MPSVQRGNRNLIKAMNRNLILNVLRREGTLSRTQVTEISGLSVGAVSQIINELVQADWIHETGESDYTGGRRQVLLKLNSSAGYALGVKVMEQRAVCAITNFEARVLHYHEQAIDTNHKPEAFCDALADMACDLIARTQVPVDKLFGIGVGLAGVIYSNKGLVRYSPYFGWRDVPLATMLQARLKLPVIIENDVNTLTITEHLFGAGRHHNDVAVITIGRGIGMGMIINGQLYRGAQGGAGELGHIIVDLERARRGEAATIEAFAADPVMLQRFQSRNGLVSTTLQTIIEAAQNGDEYAQAALRESGEYIGMALSTVINMLSPEMLIISGEGVVAGDHRLRPMLDALKRYTFDGLLDGVQVVIEPTDDQAWARGAASLVIGKVFESPLIEGHLD